MDDNDKNVPAPDSKPAEQKDEFVPKKAFAEVSADMHKYKAALKDIEAENAALKAAQKAADEQKLIDERKYKELFEKRDNELKQLREQTSAEKKRTETTEVKFLVTQALGGFKDPEYADWAIKPENVERDPQTGRIIPESLEKEVTRIKQTRAELLKGGDAKPLDSKAATTEPAQLESDLSKMSRKEQDALIMKMISEKKN